MAMRSLHHAPAVSPSPVIASARSANSTCILVPLDSFRHVCKYIGPIGEVTRLWTIRNLDSTASEADFDFFIRPGSGLGLDWAKRAVIGDRIAFMLIKSTGSTPDKQYRQFTETGNVCALDQAVRAAVAGR
jgi:NADPH-dependent ferric siderophore reductase